jgi:prephenate dehydratase
MINIGKIVIEVRVDMNKNTKIAFQGRPGAYSESACLHLYGNKTQLLALATFEEVFLALENEEVDFAVLPFENSTTGSIHENFDLSLRFRPKVVAEVKLRIEHCLMTKSEFEIQDLKVVRSHPQALAQCSELFRKYPHMMARADFDTAGSAELIASEGGPQGAIASALAAEVYGLKILEYNIQNSRNSNFTRFWSLAKNSDEQKDWNKTSVIFIPKENQPGVLYGALKILADRNIDLVKVESRPRAGSPWEYIFYLDMIGKPDSIHDAIEKLSCCSQEVVVLGHYSNGSTQETMIKNGGFHETKSCK